MSVRFRDTLWFKKGMQDAQARDEAALDEDELRPAAVDLLPIEDRYEDDGSVTREDSKLFSVHTGATQGLPRIKSTSVAPPQRDGFDLLVRQMKRGRQKVFAMLGVAVAAVVVVACWM